MNGENKLEKISFFVTYLQTNGENKLQRYAYGNRESITVVTPCFSGRHLFVPGRDPLFLAAIFLYVAAISCFPNLIPQIRVESKHDILGT